MKYVLWVLQVVLALFFISIVATRYLTPWEEYIANPLTAWAVAIPPVILLIISILEVLGAIGLILPAAMRIMPELTAWAAAGLFLTMFVAGIFHVVRGEFDLILPIVIWASLSAFVAYGRFVLKPIPPRAQAVVA